MTPFERLMAWLRPGKPTVADEAAYLRVDPPAPRNARGAGDLPRFQGLAGDVGTAPGEHPHRARLSRAFTPSQPIADLRSFSGRGDLVGRLIRAIEDQRMHVVLYGDRGMGKTSLLHILTILAREARYLVRYYSCSETSGFDETFRAVAKEIPLLFHRDYDPTSREAEEGKTLADTLGDRELSASYLADALERVSGTRVLVVLDEFDRTRSAEFRRSVAELIKNLSDRAARVQLVIGGVAGNLTELIEQIPSIRRNIAGIAVAGMSDDEIVRILARGESVSGLTFAEAARALVLSAAGGSPYLANLIGQNAGIEAIDRRAREISEANTGAAIDRIVDDLTQRLDNEGRVQLAMLEQNFTGPVLRALARHALDNFGEVIPHREPALAELTRAPGAAAGATDDVGRFRFADDSIPLILWLSHIEKRTGTRISPAKALRTYS